MERVCIGKLETVNISRKEFRRICAEKAVEGKMMKELLDGTPPAISLGITLAIMGTIAEIDSELFGECNCEKCRGGAIILQPERVASCGPRTQ